MAAFRKAFKNAVFDGEVKDGRRTGKGKYIFNHSDSAFKREQEGNWVDNKMVGEGKVVYKNGNTFEGTFVDGKRSGKGRFTWANGDIFEGLVSNSLVDLGHATSYKYEWIGKGTLTLATSGRVFEDVGYSDKKDDMFSDKSYFTHACGNLLEGEVVESKTKTGTGKMTNLENTDTYEGEFELGKESGKGKYTFHEKVPFSDPTLYRLRGVFEGNYREGKMHGEGKLTLVDGSVYEGEFVEGRESGKGKKVSSSGQVYEGEWKEGSFHGKGLIFYPKDGSTFEGDFVEGHKTGKGKITYSNGDVYEGEYKDGSRKDFQSNYPGKYTWANGNVFTGNFYKNYKYQGETYSSFPLVMNGSVHEASTGTVYTAVFTNSDKWRENLTALSDVGKEYTYKSMLYTAKWSVDGQEGVAKEGEFLNGSFL